MYESYVDDKQSLNSKLEKSDVVFAHRFLEKHCKQENLPYIYLNDFSKIIDYLEALKTSEGDVRK